MDEVWRVLSNAPVEAWLGLIGVAFGSLLTTFGVWLTNIFNRKHLQLQFEHEEKLQRQRHSRIQLEELFVLLDQWGNRVSDNCMHLVRVIEEHITYDVYLKNFYREETSRPDLTRMDMIVHIHGGQLEIAYHQALHARSKLRLVEDSCREAILKGNSSKSFLDFMSTVQNGFTETWTNFRLEIVKAAKEV